MQEVILITGANGEVGHALIPELAKSKNVVAITLDINELDDTLKPFAHEVVIADILDSSIIDNLLTKHSVGTVFHLASILSTGGERKPERAPRGNVDGNNSLFSSLNPGATPDKR